MENKHYWTLEVNGGRLPIVFTQRGEAIEYAEKNLAGPSYTLIRHDEYAEPRVQARTVCAK